MTGSSSRTKATKKPWQARVVRGSSGDSMIIKHRELIGQRNLTNISEPTLLLTFQPGNLSWLRAFSSRFEYYEVLSATIEIVSASGANAAGSHAVSIDYDVSDLPPADYNAMYNGGNVVSACVWKDINLKVKPQNIHPRRKLCTQGFAPPGTDNKLYDAFNVYHYAPNTTYAEYYISYEVKLTVPQIAGNVAGVVEGTGEVTNPVGNQQYFSGLKVGGDGKVPVGVRKPTPLEVAERNMFEGVDVIELAKNAAYILELYGKTNGADAASLNQYRSDGITFKDLHTQNMKTVDDKETCSFMECITDNGKTGLLQFGMNTVDDITEAKAIISRIMKATL